MGKKTKKTKWRTLEISTPGKNVEHTTATNSTTSSVSSNGRWEDGRRATFVNYHHHHHHQQHNHHHQYQPHEKPTPRRQSSSSAVPVSGFTSSSNVKYSSSKEETKTLIEDEYTKITTPRQDVLFKKGYLTRRKVLPETVNENSVDQNSDDIAQDCSNNEDFSNFMNGDDSVEQFVCPNPQSFMDPSALYYGGGYEIYDPYTGNVTVVVGPPANQYPSNNSCQPILTSVPCRPVPLQPVQWFNPVPSSDWCCPYSPQDKRYSTDSQNGNAMDSESSGVPESPPEIVDETFTNNGPVFPQSYVYPGYMFGAPIYNVDGVNVQYYTPPSPELSSTTEQTASKRRKKRKRRRRTGETEEETESSIDDNCNRSISSNEYISDFQSHIASLDYGEDDDKKHYSVISGNNLLYSSLPQSIVNAPEFIPAEFSVQCAPSPLHPAVTSSLPTVPSPSLPNSRDNSPPTPNYMPKSSTAGLNVYCKPFDAGRSIKHDSERVSSSNNSDSGISSPGSEEISKREFRTKEVKSERSGAGSSSSSSSSSGCSSGIGATGDCSTGVCGDTSAKFKKPRARRSNKTLVKNKVSEKSVETTPKVRQSNQQQHQNASTESAAQNAKPTKSNESKRDGRSTKVAVGQGVQSVQKRELSNTTTASPTKSSRISRKVKNDTVISKIKPKESKKKLKREENVTDDAERNGTKSTLFEQLLEHLASDEPVFPVLETCANIPVIEHSDGHLSEVENETIGERLADALATPTPPPKELSRCEGCTTECSNSNGSATIAGACNRDIEDDCELLPSKCDKQKPQQQQQQLLSLSSKPLTPEAEPDLPAPSPTSTEIMLNEYVCIEKQPVLAKLVDLNELTNECGASSLDDLSISEYSSCRENAVISVAFKSAATSIAQQTAPTPPPRLKKPNRKFVESAAVALIDDVIASAQKHVLSSSTASSSSSTMMMTTMTTSCDKKFQLPVTQAVTRWLNEHGGLPTMVVDEEQHLKKIPNDCHFLEEEEFDESDEEQVEENKVEKVKMAVTMTTVKTQKKLKQNCVIC